MIDDPNIEHEERPEYDENGELIWYPPEMDIPDEFTPYNFTIENDPYANSLDDEGNSSSSVASLADEEDKEYLNITNPLDVETELLENDISEDEGQLNAAEDTYNTSVESIIELLTKVLEAGEITAEDNANLLQAEQDMATSSETIRDICANQPDNSLLRTVEELKENMVGASIDDILDILTDGGTKPWLYKDDDNNVLMDGTSIPELTMLVNKLNLIATGGDDEQAEIHLTPEFIDMVVKSSNDELSTQYKQLSDKFTWLVKSGDSESSMVLTDKMYELISKNITLTADHIKLEGYTTINSGFSVDTSGNMSCINANIAGTITGSTISGSVFKSGAEYNPNSYNITGLKMEDDTIYSYGTKNNGVYGVTKISGGIINIGDGADGAGLACSAHISSSDISLFRQGGNGYFYVGTTEAPTSGSTRTTTTIDTNTINIGSKDVTTAFKVDYNNHCEFGNNYFTRGSLTINQQSIGVAKGTQTFLSGSSISSTNIYQNGSQVSGSDIVLKDNIKEYEDSALDIINQTKVYSFNRILANQDKTEIGFLAQQVPEIFLFDKGEFTAEELEGLTAEEKKELLAKKTEDYKAVLENRKLDEISENVASFYDLDSEQTEKQIEQIMDEYHNVEYEVPISTINQNNIIAIMFKAIQELSQQVEELKKTCKNTSE